MNGGMKKTVQLLPNKLEQKILETLRVFRFFVKNWSRVVWTGLTLPLIVECTTWNERPLYASANTSLSLDHSPTFDPLCFQYCKRSLRAPSMPRWLPLSLPLELPRLCRHNHLRHWVCLYWVPLPAYVVLVGGNVNIPTTSCLSSSSIYVELQFHFQHQYFALLPWNFITVSQFPLSINHFCKMSRVYH